MNIVVDTSALIAVIANEPERDRLVERTRGTDLLAPHSVHWEIGNAFSAMLKRQRITLEQALRAVEVYKRIPIRFVDVELAEALHIANTLGIYAYDAYLIECAIRYKAPLLSLDQSLVGSARRMQVQVLEVSQ